MDILLFLGLYAISVIPSLLLYKWIKKKSDEYLCKKAFIKGITAIFLIILFSGTLSIVGNLSGLKDYNIILYKAYYTFFVLAFSEELAKFLMFKSLLKKNPKDYSWFNLTILMTIVGIGFGCFENLFFAAGSNVIEMAIRSISIGHAGYGFIMGWFYGKMLNTGEKIYGVLGFIIPWTLHGFYDFGLSEELLKVNDDLAFISLTLEAFCIVLVFLIIRFVKKRAKSDIYSKGLMKQM